MNISDRLEYLRKELRAERISYGEIAELQSLVPHIDPSDVELLEAAGVPEFEEDTHITEVMFRRVKEDGSIEAYFPYEISQGYDATCYAQIGQHGACTHKYITENTVPAYEHEYKDLKSELEGIGYKLKIIKRRRYNKFLKAYYASKGINV